MSELKPNESDPAYAPVAEMFAKHEAQHQALVAEMDAMHERFQRGEISKDDYRVDGYALVHRMMEQTRWFIEAGERGLDETERGTQIVSTPGGWPTAAENPRNG